MLLVSFRQNRQVLLPELNTMRIFALLFFLAISESLDPPRLDDDTDINHFGSDQQDPDTELVAEQPVGSGQ